MYVRELAPIGFAATVRNVHITNYISFFSFLTLAILVFFSPTHAVYDEGWYLSAVDLFREHGLSVEFVRDQPGPAGPTFSLIQGLLEPVTGLAFPAVRWVSVGLLLLSTLLVAQTTAALNPSVPRMTAWTWGGTFLAMPFVGVSAGMALTEMPGVFFFGIALLLLMSGQGNRGRSVSLAIGEGLVAGVALALAILARQNYLLCAVGLSILWLGASPTAKLRMVVAFCMAAILVVPVFVIWNGLVPMNTASVGNGYSLFHFVLSLAYLNFIVLIISPSPVLKRVSGADAVPAIFATLCLIMLLWYGEQIKPFLPMASVAKSVLPDFLLNPISFLFPLFLIMMAGLFIANAASMVKRSLLDRDWCRVYLWGAIIVLCLANGKITHQFSSRYVLAAVPFLLLALPPVAHPRRAYLARLVIGAILSLAALHSYFA